MKFSARIPGFVSTAAVWFAAMADAAEPPEAPGDYWDTFKLWGQVDAGITGNLTGSKGRLNFGQLFTDKANQVLLNQVLVTAERPIDPKLGGYDFGFKLQAMYGSDARYTHFLGEFDRSIRDRNQVDIVEAFAALHTPWIGEGGLDIKVGQFVTLLGAETIDPSTNYFYSHSYLFSFGIPFKHTGVMTVTHVNDVVDLYAGLDTGVNTTLGRKGDNNSALAFQGGIGLTLMEGKLTVLATTHIGPENPRGTPGVKPNKDLRYLNDMVVTYKPSETRTFITDLNFIRDDGFHANGYGVVQYWIETLSEELAFVARGEVWRDNNGFFVGAFPGNLDFVNLQRGFPATVIGGGRTTYGALTAGLNIKFPNVNYTEAVTLRPELRYDRSLNNTTPFDGGRSRHQLTLGMDLLIRF
jgi:hypothetical protein